jgi:hypothetical protein
LHQAEEVFLVFLVACGLISRLSLSLKMDVASFVIPALKGARGQSVWKDGVWLLGSFTFFLASLRLLNISEFSEKYSLIFL